MGKDENDREIVLATCIDDAYLPFVWVVARSAAWSARHRRITFHVFHAGSERAMAERLGRLRSWGLRVVVHAVKDELDHLYRSNRHPPITYLRLKLPELLPDEAKVIYLDADLLVRRDIGEMFDLDLGGSPAAAVPDVPQPLHFRSPRFTGPVEKYYTDVLQIPYDPERLTYVNAGVLVLDLAQLRVERFVERALVKAEELIDRTLWHDQDVLNALLNGRFVLLDAAWNVMPQILSRPISGSADVRRLALRQHENQWIVHFASSLKPWRVAGMPFSREWWLWATFSPVGKDRLRNWAEHQIEKRKRIKPAAIEVFKRTLPRTFAATFRLWQAIRGRSR